MFADKYPSIFKMETTFLYCKTRFKRAVVFVELGGVAAWWSGSQGYCFYSWARHLHVTLTVPLFTQVYKWVPPNLMQVVTMRWSSTPFRGEVEILLVASCHRNRDKLPPVWPLDSYADFTFTCIYGGYRSVMIGQSCETCLKQIW